MSKYNSYARQLDTAFKTARDQYNAALNKVKEAEQALKMAKSRGKWQEKVIGENERLVKQAECDLYDARADFKAIEETVWPAFSQTVNGLTNDLEQAIRKDNELDPDSLDENGIKLLDSGMLTFEDFESLAQKYDNNPAMLRFISKAARKAADGMRDSEDNVTRGKLIMLADNTSSGNNSVMRQWDDLKQCASIYNGSSRGTKDAELIARLSDHWEQGTAQAIESF